MDGSPRREMWVVVLGLQEVGGAWQGGLDGGEVGVDCCIGGLGGGGVGE